MKFIKKNKKIILIAILSLLVLFGLISLKNYFSGESGPIYGNRLDGRKKLIISKETQKKVKDKIKESTTDVKIRIAGRIIYITATVKDEVSLEDAKKLGPSVLEEFQDSEKGYYDIQLFIKNNANSNQFPIIGYKHHAKTSFTWTKDRAGS